MPDKDPYDLAEKIFLYQTNSLSPAERAALEKQLVTDPKLTALLEELKSPIQVQNELQRITRFDPHRAYSDALSRVYPNRRWLYVRYVWIAASILMILMLGILFRTQWFNGRPEIIFARQDTADGIQLVLSTGERIRTDTLSSIRSAEAQFEGQEGLLNVESIGTASISSGDNKIIVPYNKKYQVVLADGSRVFLNAGSTLTFPSSFTGNERKVKLQGEAFFEIVTLPDKQFVVEVGSQEIYVHGTVFNVKAYANEPFHYTTLMKGSISLRNSRTKNQLFVEPGYQVCYEQSTGKSIKRPVNTTIASSWKDGWFAFDDMSMDEILRQLGRWYNLEIVLDDPSIHALRATGKIFFYPDVDHVLRKFEKLGDVRFQTTDKRINVQHVSHPK